MNCHCDSMLPFANCCQPLLEGKKEAPTALALMRSRYSAHVEKNADYIWKTYGELQRKSLSIEQLQKGIEQITWQELEILRIVRGRPDDDYGEVEFVAHYLQQNMPMSMMEHSFFQKEQDQWKYIGQITNT